MSVTRRLLNYSNIPPPIYFNNRRSPHAKERDFINKIIEDFNKPPNVGKEVLRVKRAFIAGRHVLLFDNVPETILELIIQMNN